MFWFQNNKLVKPYSTVRISEIFFYFYEEKIETFNISGRKLLCSYWFSAGDEILKSMRSLLSVFTLLERNLFDFEREIET